MTNPLSKLGAGYAALSNLFTCLSPLENRSKQHSRHAIPGSVRSQRQSRFNKKCPQRPPALQISFQSSTEHRKKYSKGIGSLKMQYKQLSCTSICKLFVILIFFFFFFVFLKGDYDVVINDYEKAKSLFGKTEVQVFKKCKVFCILLNSVYVFHG